MQSFYMAFLYEKIKTQLLFQDLIIYSPFWLIKLNLHQPAQQPKNALQRHTAGLFCL